MGLRLELLGDPRVLRDGEALELPASKKTRALLGYLVATGRDHTRERLCSLLWDGPDDPRAQLRWSLWKLRSFVGERLVATRDHVGFRALGADVDLSRVRSALAGGVAAASTESLIDAAAQFRGDFLEGLDLPACLQFDAWCVAERASLRQLRASVLATLVERLPAAEALPHARAWVAVDPLVEAAHAEVVRILGELGMQRDALAQYETCERILASELDARPSRRMEQLRMQLTATSTPAAKPANVAVPIVRTIVGRDRELAMLADARGVVLVTGEPGIGKTRLLEEVASRTHALVGRSYEAEQVRPYGPWIDALRGLPRSALDHDLAALLPELAPMPTVIEDRTRLFDAVVRTLRGTAKPTVVILDDIHWLDDASAALLHFVARVDLGVTILLGARDEELADNAAALRVVRALRRAGLLELPLAPLSRDATALLAPGVDADRVHVESEGNPLFAIEIGRALASGATALPETIEGLLAERLERVDDKARALVSWAAALGRSFDLDVLGRATAMPAIDLVAAVEDLERRNIVRATPTGYDFTHDLVRRAAYAKLSAPRRRLCHAQIAGVLAATIDPDCGFADELARHAGLAGDDELAARACMLAGQRCLRLCAHAEGGELAERGRHHLARLEAPRRLPYEIELLWILVHARGVRQVPELTAALTTAIASAEAAARPELVARGYQALGVLKSRTGDEQGALTEMKRAAEEARGIDPIDRVQLFAQTARCCVLLGEVTRARESLREANAVAERHGVDHPERTFVEGLLLQFDGDLDAATTVLESTLDRLRARADRWRECDCLGHLAMIALERGNIDEAARRARELGAVAEKMGGGSYEGPYAAAIDALARRAADPTASVEDALQRLREIDAKSILAQVLAVLAEFELHERRAADAVRHAEAALELASATKIGNDIVRTGAVLARALRAVGETTRAGEQLAATRRAAEHFDLSAYTRRLLEDT